MAYSRRLRSWGPWLLGSTVLSMSIVEATLAMAGLYECRNEAGTIIYTDSPAQLERCQPVGGGGPSRLGVVGGASPSFSGAPVTPVPTPPASAPLSPVSSDPTGGSSTNAPPAGPTSPIGSPSGMATGTAEETPCVPGVNPLNPLSAPPCAATSLAPSSQVPPNPSPVGSEPPSPP